MPASNLGSPIGTGSSVAHQQGHQMQGPEAGKGEAAAESMDSGGRGEGRGRRGEEETSTGGSLILNADMDSSPQHSTPIPSFLPDIASPDAAIREGGAVGATLKATSGSAVEQIHEQVAPPQLQAVAQLNIHDPPTSPNPSTTTASQTIATAEHPQPTHPLRPSLHLDLSDPATKQKTVSQEGKMRFGSSSGPGSAAHRRRSMANTNAITTYEADLASEDQAMQKEAIKKYLGEIVQDDWKWPPPPEPESAVDTTQSEEGDPADLLWKERDEWLSNASDSEADPTTALKSPMSTISERSPFRFDNPDDVGDSIQKTAQDRKRRRKKRLVEEIEGGNEGLRCFIERRDAWTGARHVKRPKRTASPPKRQSQSSGGGSSTAVEELEETEASEDEDVEIPLGPPLLPTTNALRKSIRPESYNTIYDKVVLQQRTPSCPINLKDVTRSCVQGWKRDGSWPPKSVPESPTTRRRRLSVANLFSSSSTRDKDSKEKEKVKENEGEKKEKPKGALRKIKKILTLRHGNGENDDPAAAA